LTVFDPEYANVAVSGQNLKSLLQIRRFTHTISKIQKIAWYLHHR
jgi:hypothetical protein